MSPPVDAKDREEGYCIECSDWRSWDDLETCHECMAVLCQDHYLPEDHECEEDAA